MTPLTAAQALDQSFLEARSKLLDLAASLDRIERGGGIASDPRLDAIQDSLRVLLESQPSRAERIQTRFSQNYDPNWKRPQPR